MNNDIDMKNDAPETNENPIQGSNKIKDPDDWTTGDEPMTAAQKSYIETFSGNEPAENLTKAEASKVIDEHKQHAGNAASGNAIKDPNEWTTGAEPMTDAQRSYLKTLADEAGEAVDENLTKGEASKRIDALQHKTGRGLNKNAAGDEE